MDLAAYDIAANAADIEDLRVALGINQWNLQAVGTASPILLQASRLYPAGVRTLIVDSPALPGANLITVGPRATDLAIARLSAACEAHADCSRRAPGLEVTLRNALSQLDAKPLTFDVGQTPAAINAGHPISVVLDGAALLRWIRWRLESSAGSGAGRLIDTVLRVRDGTLTADDPAVLFLAADAGDCAGMLHECEHVDFGALYSIVRRQRVRASLWIGAGALVLALSTSMSRAGDYSFMYLGELVGIALMFFGFTLAGQPKRAVTRPAPAPATGRAAALAP
jgi:pimeloyl-ACP methyl ester carboxylesterase